MVEFTRRTSRTVKRWQSGDMCLRWTAAGMLEAERQFRRIVGYADLAKFALAVERDLAATRSSTTMPTTPPGGRYARHHQLTITGPSPRSSTTNGTTSGTPRLSKTNLGPRRDRRGLGWKLTALCLTSLSCIKEVYGCA